LYVVAWNHHDQNSLFTIKKGDDYWYTLEGVNCVNMAYKDHKLYLFTFDSYVKIFDFSGDFPNKVTRGNPYRNHPFRYDLQPEESVWKVKVAITNSGDVLIVVSMKGLEEKRFFNMFKMNMESGDWERAESLAGEVLIFGHGVTIKDVNGLGVKSDSICFGYDDLSPSGCLNPTEKVSLVCLILRQVLEEFLVCSWTCS
ncbi:PREDICTED: putative F-box protein At2g33200, partial [Camelina sativa]|uniref:F-box protein At2g33200 n=1 Tax=Camelina sativa TaxID=90675 RepID=A0ABM0ZHF1_CAMSA